MTRRGPGLSLGLLFVLGLAGAGVGCVTVVQKPCSTGGDPPRDKPYQGRLDRRQCEQKREKSGKYVNHGAYREWYPNGKLALEGEYRDGVRSGKWFEWDETGKLLSERWFEKGKEVPTRAAVAAPTSPEDKIPVQRKVEEEPHAKRNHNH